MEALVKLLEGAEDAFVAKGALGAISSLVQGNPTNKLAVREANGIEVRPLSYSLAKALYLDRVL